MCCSGPAWKREVVPDHKFDFIDTREFHSTAFSIRLRYLWLYLTVVKSFLVYVSDIFTAITMLTTKDWANSIFKSCPTDNCFIIDFKVGRWLFVGCIIFSFLLLAYETHKSKKIIASRDISYAFTNVMANNYYSLRSYDHFCFFCQISNSTKKKDDFAFFVFFTFKSWKRVLFADGPRQTINALTLYSFYRAMNAPGSTNPAPWYSLSKYSNDLVTSALIMATLFTVLVFVGSLLLLLAAGLCYIPLLCYIQGNLKEYCCHKVDKRIAELMKRKTKQRLVKNAALARKEAAGDFSHLKNKKGELIAQPLPQPTLPKIDLEDSTDGSSSIRTRVDSDGKYSQSDYKTYQYVQESPSVIPDYPPMPAYHSQRGYDYNAPAAPYPYYEQDSNMSTVNLAQAAAPISGYHESSTLPNPHGSTRGGYYDGNSQYSQNRGYHPSQRDQNASGLAYDDYYTGADSTQPYYQSRGRGEGYQR